MPETREIQYGSSEQSVDQNSPAEINDAVSSRTAQDMLAPINTILGALDEVLNTELTPQQRECLQTIFKSSVLLLDVVGGIVDRSEMDAGSPEMGYSPLVLSEVVDRVASSMAMLAKGKSLVLSVETDPLVHREVIGNAAWIERAITYLGRSAVMWAEKGRVRLSVMPVAGAQGDSDKVVFKWSATVPGIGRQNLRDERSFPCSHPQDGGGQGPASEPGLAICQRIVARMGGEMSLASRPDGEVDFSFAIPLLATQEAPPERGASRCEGAIDGENVGRLKGVRVLVVEDNDLNQEISREILENEGGVVTIAENGKEAIEAIRVNHFNVVLMDIHMPLMDGVTATKVIRSDARHANLPIIALTAHSSTDERNRCLHAGMSDFLGKPLNPEDLVNVVAAYASRPADRDNIPALAQDSCRGPGRLPGAIEGIDIQVGLGFSAGREDFYIRMLGRFLETKGDHVGELRELLASGNREESYRFAHAMKSIAGHIGATELASISAGLEKSIKNEADEVELSEMLNDYESRLSVVVRGIGVALRSVQRPENERAAERVEETDVRGLINEVEKCLSTDIGRVIELWPGLKSCLTSKGREGDVNAFEKHLEAFDSKAAIQDLVNIKTALGY